MANIGDTNFSMKPDVNMAAIASLYQKKATDEQQMKLQQSQIESQQQDRVMNVMKMASDLTQGIIQTSAHNQMMAGRKNLQDLLGQGNDIVPGNQMTPASSSVLPQLSQAPISVPQSQTPEFQGKVKQSLLQANPQAVTEAMATQQFPKAPTTTDQLLATSLMNGNQGMANQVTTAKQNEKPPQIGKIFQQVGPDGKAHNMRLEANGNTTDLGLSASTNRGMSSINRLLPDGTTHKIMIDSAGNEKDLGMVGSSTTNVPPAQVRNTSVVAKQVLPHFDEVRSLIDEADAKGLIGPGAGRIYGKFLAGKIGKTGNDENDRLLGKLKTESDLLASAALKVHFGARGGQQMYEHFTKNLDTTTQSKALLNGELDGFESYLKGYANPNPQEQTPKNNSGIPEVGGTFNGGKVLKVTRIK